VEQFAQVQLRVLALGGGSIPEGTAGDLLGLRPGYGMQEPIVPCDPESELAEGPVRRTLRKLRG